MKSRALLLSYRPPTVSYSPVAYANTSVRPDAPRQVDLEDVVIVAVVDASRHRRPQRYGRGRGEGVAVVVSRLGRGNPRTQHEAEGDQEE